MENKCPCCGEQPKPCPFCGEPGKVYGENIVGCSDHSCGGSIDFGHWCGVENGIPAIHWVIKQWNTRSGDKSHSKLKEKNVQ